MAAEERVSQPLPGRRRTQTRKHGPTPSLDPVENHVLLRSLQVAPWVAVIVIAADLLIDLVDGAFPLGLSQLMFLSGVAAAAIVLFVFLTLLDRIGDTFGVLWNRHVVTATREATSVSPVTDEPESAPPLGTRKRTNPNPDYPMFLGHLQARLNSPVQWILGVSFVPLVITWSPGAIVLQAFQRYPADAALSSFDWYVLAAVIVEAFVAFVVGTMAWRMIVVGIEVSRLGKKYNLRPQLGHPDQCGGLEPLGDLCLWNALIVSIAGVYLGGWIIILRPGLPVDRLSVQYVPLFLELLVVPLAVAAITFFLPLWNVHREMLARSVEVRRQLDELGQSIDRSARELLERADELPLAEGEERAKRLELMRQTYQQCRDVPVWPFNVQTLIKFVSSQAVPMLALTGLSEPIRDVLKSLFGSLQG